MYKLRLSRREKKKLLRSKWLIVIVALLCVGFVVWLIWIRPIQKETTISTFDECVRAGNPIQETYPEVCLTKHGKRFVNPRQQQAHQESLTGSEELVPPSNPALLKLDMEEWGVQIPLTLQTFDLTYTYIKNSGIEQVTFTYKRLLQLNVCKGDIGLVLTRSTMQHQPPFTDTNPAPIAQLGTNYFYAIYASKPCYDINNVDQATLVKAIAGEKSLVQATADLLSSLRAVSAN